MRYNNASSLLSSCVCVFTFVHQLLHLLHVHFFSVKVCCSERQGDRCLHSYSRTIYAPNREWVPAQISSNTQQSVTLSWSEHQSKCRARHVTALRFLWSEDACAQASCPVYDARTNLPMGPYIKQGLLDDSEYHDFTRDATKELAAPIYDLTDP